MVSTPQMGDSPRPSLQVFVKQRARLQPSKGLLPPPLQPREHAAPPKTSASPGLEGVHKLCSHRKLREGVNGGQGSPRASWKKE